MKNKERIPQEVTGVNEIEINESITKTENKNPENSKEITVMSPDPAENKNEKETISQLPKIESSKRTDKKRPVMDPRFTKLLNTLISS